MKVLVTGGSGFVGTAVTPLLAAEGWFVRSTARQRQHAPINGEFMTMDLDGASDLQNLVKGMDVVVHLAGRAHVMRAQGADEVTQFRRVNVDASAALARAARGEGVRHFIFVSSIKVNGEETAGSSAYTENDRPDPQDPYAKSKLEAEQALLAEVSTNMALTILRPPLMYGPHAKGNFARLMRLVRAGVPLPLASVDNQRSVLYVGNLGAAVVRLLKDPTKGSSLYLLSDGASVSTPELIRAMAAAVGRPARLMPFPPALLRAGGRMMGLGAEVRRLTGSLRIDDSLIRRELGWEAPYSMHAAMQKMASSL